MIEEGTASVKNAPGHNEVDDNWLGEKRRSNEWKRGQIHFYAIAGIDVLYLNL